MARASWFVLTPFVDVRSTYAACSVVHFLPLFFSRFTIFFSYWFWNFEQVLIIQPNKKLRLHNIWKEVFYLWRYGTWVWKLKTMYKILYKRSTTPIEIHNKNIEYQKTLKNERKLLINCSLSIWVLKTLMTTRHFMNLKRFLLHRKIVREI